MKISKCLFDAKTLFYNWQLLLITILVFACYLSELINRTRLLVNLYEWDPLQFVNITYQRPPWSRSSSSYSCISLFHSPTALQTLPWKRTLLCWTLLFRAHASCRHWNTRISTRKIGTYTCNTIYVQRNTTTVNCPLNFKISLYNTTKSKTNKHICVLS